MKLLDDDSTEHIGLMPGVYVIYYKKYYGRSEADNNNIIIGLDKNEQLSNITEFIATELDFKITVDINKLLESYTNKLILVLNKEPIVSYNQPEKGTF